MSKVRFSEHSVKTDNELSQSYDRWVSAVVSSALLAQAYFAPFVSEFLKRAVDESDQFANFSVSAIAFVITAGVIYTLGVRSLLVLYQNRLWYWFNPRFCIAGKWDAGYSFRTVSAGGTIEKPTGYIQFDQDFLGRFEASLYYNFDEALGIYRSESSLFGYVSGSSKKPRFHLFFKTQHQDGVMASDDWDTSHGIEIVEATEFSTKRKYPKRLFGEYFFYKRDKNQNIGGGATRYNRNDDLSIEHIPST